MAAGFHVKARKAESWLNREFGANFEVHTHHPGMFLPRFSEGEHRFMTNTWSAFQRGDSRRKNKMKCDA